MIQDPHTHLLLHRMTTDEVVARRQHQLDRLPQRRRLARRVWSALRRTRHTPQPTTAPAPPVALAADATRCADSARPAPRAA